LDGSRPEADSPKKEKKFVTVEPEKNQSKKKYLQTLENKNLELSAAKTATRFDSPY